MIEVTNNPGREFVVARAEVLQDEALEALATSKYSSILGEDYEINETNVTWSIQFELDAFEVQARADELGFTRAMKVDETCFLKVVLAPSISGRFLCQIVDCWGEEVFEAFRVG